MGDVITRWLTPNDQPAFAALAQRAPEMKFFLNFWVDDFEEWAESEDYLFGLFIGERLIGVCTIGGDADSNSSFIGLLSDVYIESTEQHKGYGRMMVEAVINDIRNTSQYKVINLQLLESSLDQWYTLMGFVPTEADSFGTTAMQLDLITK